MIKIDFSSRPWKGFSCQGELAFKFLSQRGLDKLMDETKIKKKTKLTFKFLSQFSLDKLMDETKIKISQIRR